MKPDKKKALVAVLASMILTLPIMAENVVSEGQLLSSMCNTCHGFNGKGAKSIPNINGRDPAELFDTLKAFSSGNEPTSIMDRFTKGYTDAQLRTIATYLSEQ